MSAAAPLNPREAFERFVRWTIEKEYGPVQSRLPAGEREAFADYYKRLPAPGDEAAIRRYLRGFWRSEAGWTARWIGARAKEIGSRPRVMDAGSGFGTYSMLYAAAGGEVVGADLRPDRLDAAEKRLAFHRELTGETLPVRYARADLTREWDGDYDMVWVYNALSHIDPLEAFLAQTRKHLKKGGVLVVGDINGAHPEHLARLNELRGDDVHQEYVAPDGERHQYAVERPFPPAEIRQIFETNGFRMVNHELYWGGLGALPEPLYQLFMQPLQKQWSLGHGVARRQLVVATPA
jgi:SAM-dependent methyltransferase